MKLLPAALALSCVCTASAQTSAPILAPPEYAATTPSHGVLRIWGSPQMADLLHRYEEGFHRLQPGVRFVEELKSTITAVAGVYSGRAEIGLLGREIWPLEEQAFVSIENRPPVVIAVATGSYDVPKATFALMIVVPRDNPLSSLSLPQLERIFGSPQDGRHYERWGDLGLTGTWADKPIHLYGFATENDKAQIFSQIVFAKGEHWSSSLREFGNGADGKDAGERITHSVAQDPLAIGISNAHYLTPDLKMLPLAPNAHSAPVAPNRESVEDHSYPLTRSVYMVMTPGKDLKRGSPAGEFLRFVLSRQGQEAVRQEGNYLPLPATERDRQLEILRAAAN